MPPPVSKIAKNEYFGVKKMCDVLDRIGGNQQIFFRKLRKFSYGEN